MSETEQPQEAPESSVEDKVSRRLRVFLWGEILERFGGIFLGLLIVPVLFFFWLFTLPLGTEMRDLERKEKALSYLSDRKNETFLYAFERVLWKFGLELRLQKEMLLVQQHKWEELKKALNSLEAGEAKTQQKAFLRKIRGYMRNPDEVRSEWRSWSSEHKHPLGDYRWKELSDSLSFWKPQHPEKTASPQEEGFFSLKNWQKWLESRGCPSGYEPNLFSSKSDISLDGGFDEFFLKDLEKALKHRAWALEELKLPPYGLSFDTCLALIRRSKRAWKGFIQEVKTWEPQPVLRVPDPSPLQAEENPQEPAAPSHHVPETKTTFQENAV